MNTVNNILESRMLRIKNAIMVAPAPRRREIVFELPTLKLNSEGTLKLQ